jgi:hypothetical protein
MTKRSRSELQLFACALWLCGAGCVGAGPDAGGTESAVHHGYGTDAGQAAAGSGGGSASAADADGGSDEQDADAGTDEHHHHHHHHRHHHKTWCWFGGGGPLGHGSDQGDDGDDQGGALGQ